MSDDLTKSACLNYLCWEDTDVEAARRLFEENPDITQTDLHSACCVGDVEAVARHLTDDPAAVRRRGGHFDWEPLMYACYSRLFLPDKSTYEVAACLLEHGADPNAHFMWGDQYRFTALCGLFAEGESGPIKYPAHPECARFARLLLEAGADPNDGQALYNTMFTPDDTCLELMLAYGLNAEHRCNWLLQDCQGGELKPHPEQTLRYQLKYAIKAGYRARARLLMDHGATLLNLEGEAPLHKMALLAGEPKIAEDLLAKGAPPAALEGVEAFAAACLAGDEATARAWLAEDPDWMVRTQKAFPELLEGPAERGRESIMRLLVDLGADLHAHRSPLFTAVWHGQMAMVKLLIALGADPTIRDPTHHATPKQWAIYQGDREAIRTYLEQVEDSGMA